MTLEAERDLAIRLAYAAGEIALEVYSREFTPSEKADRSPVTEADERINEFLVEQLSSAFPEDLVVGEESDLSGEINAHRAWFVDPVDGTKDFIKKNGEWSIMIGLAIDGAASLGVVFEPAFGRLYWAVSGEGAYERRDGQDVPLRVTEESDPAKATIVMSRSHPDARILKVVEALGVANQYSHGSVGCKLADIAEGRADMYFNFSGRCSMWDTCGPEVIIREAGGDMVGFDGERIEYRGATALVAVPFVAVANAWMKPVLQVTRAMADELAPERHP